MARVYNRLKQTATPSRDKLACMVPASELLDLGIALMDTCDRAQNETYKATRYRDGLLIALLISCPMRLKNLASLVLGQHLVFDGHGYQVKLTPAETKNGRPYIAAVPHELTPYIDRWLQVYRPVPLMAKTRAMVGHTEKHLWINRSGKPMTSHAIHAQITSRTRRAFGNAIWPHLFRDCAVTELVDSAPEQIGIAPDPRQPADHQQALHPGAGHDRAPSNPAADFGPTASCIWRLTESGRRDYPQLGGGDVMPPCGQEGRLL